MIFQTEKQLKEFGDKLSDDKKSPIEAALEELKKAHESKDPTAIDSALDKINEAWKNASEEMYKAQSEAGQGADGSTTPPNNLVQRKKLRMEMTYKMLISKKLKTDRYIN